MFCHNITENWRGRPLVSHEVVVNVIGATTTQGGLAIRSELDEATYPTGQEVTDEEMDGTVHQARYVSWRVELQPATQIRIPDTVLWRVSLARAPQPHTGALDWERYVRLEMARTTPDPGGGDPTSTDTRRA